MIKKDNLRSGSTLCHDSEHLFIPIYHTLANPAAEWLVISLCQKCGVVNTVRLNAPVQPVADTIKAGR